MAWTKAKIATTAGLVLVLVAGTPILIHRDSQHESDARLDQAKKWAVAFIMFADAHANQLPKNLNQARVYVPGLSDANWEIMSGGDENDFGNYSKTILLREKKSRQLASGKFVKTYAFADGHAEKISSPDNNFAAVEKQRGLLIRPAMN